MANYVVVGILVWFVVLGWLKVSSESRKLAHIPALTADSPLLSYFGAFQFLVKGGDLLQRGYNKYKDSVFKVPEFFCWHVFVTGKRLVDELRKAEEHELSLLQAVADSLQIQLTLGDDLHAHAFHIPIIRTYLTRDLGVVYPALHEELVAACLEAIPLIDDWHPVLASDTVIQTICRASNRVFVGLPLCRNPEFLELNTKFTLELVKSGFLVGAFPSFMRKFVARYTPVRRLKALSEELLRPFILERMNDTENKFDDMLSRLVKAAPSGESPVSSVSLRISKTNFAAIHTSSTTFLHVLYHVAASPEYQADLREEVDTVVATYGWSKDALARMIKVDSFIKETARYLGLSTISLTRKAAKDFTFSDGTFIPKGTLISTTSRAMYFDDEYYENAEVFDPWRFSRVQKDGHTDSSALRNQFVNTHPELLTFGSGKHVCPGRFFASAVLKTFLAHLVYTYDMKMENEGVVPPPLRFMTYIVPNKKAKVMFRKRQR